MPRRGAASVAGLISCAWSVVGVSGAVRELSIPDPRIATCDFRGEEPAYRDTASLQCSTCTGTGETVFNEDLAGGCTCRSGYQRVYNGFALEYFACEACASATPASSADVLACQSCGSSTTGYDSASGQCGCGGATEVLVKESPVGVSLGSQECLPCASTERKVGDQCVACESPKVWVTASGSTGGSCMCPSGLAAGIFCEDEPDEAAALRVGFSSDVVPSVSFYNIFNPKSSSDTGRSRTLSSAYMTAYLVDSADKCQFNLNSTACQHLANMCVMTGYDLTTVACQLHAEAEAALTASAGVTNAITGWPARMPWIFYAEKATSVYADTGIELTLTLGSSAGSGTNVDALQFKVARYSAFGDFLGIDDVAGHLDSCGGTYKEKVSWHSIGVSYVSECSKSFSNLITLFPGSSAATSTTDQEFWDFYLEIKGSSSEPTIYPVPVRVKGLKAANGDFVNADSNQANDVLVRRFMPFDTISGRAGLALEPSLVRYMKSVTLTITGRDDDPSKIIAPVLEIEYANVELSYLSSPTPILLEVVYENNQTAFWTAVIAVFSICGVLALAVTVPRVYLFVQKTRSSQVRLGLIVHAILAFGDSMADAGLVGLLIFSTYMFFTYKFGASFAPMPRQEQSNPLIIIIIVGTCFKAAWVLSLLYDQCNLDIFFIDWERRPLKEEDALREALEAKSKIKTKDRDFIDDDDIENERREWAEQREAARDAMNQAGNLDDLGKLKGIPGVSTWRKVFVANEWSELSSFRKFNPTITAILAVAMLEGLELKYLASYSTDITSTEPGIISPILRFFVDVVFFWGITQLQRLYFFVFYYRYFGEPTERFIDCLSLTNISIFFLDTSRLHGYYLHGRSSSDADVDMPTVLGRLHEYETGLGVGRGLLGSSAVGAPHAAVASRDGSRDYAENQCFEVFLSSQSRQLYEGSIAKVLQDYTKDSMANTGKLGANIALGTGMREIDTSSVFASSELPLSVKEELTEVSSKVWKTFIDRVISQAGSAVREMNFIMERTGVPPAESNLGANVGQDEEQHSLLFHDFVERWCSALLVGIEHNLNLLDTLVFVSFDYLWNGNLYVACAAVFLVDLGIRTIRRTLGDMNITSKADVPQRYILV